MEKVVNKAGVVPALMVLKKLRGEARKVYDLGVVEPA